MKKNSIIKPLYFLIGITAITLAMFFFTGDFSKIVVWLLSVYSFEKAQKAKYFFSPYYLFIITFLSYIMYNPDWGGFFMDELTIRTKALCLLSFVTLLLGAGIIEKKCIRRVIIGRRIESFYIILIIGFIPTVMSLLLFGNITELEGSEMADAKSKFVLPVIGQLAYFLPASIIVACKQDNFNHTVIGFVLSLFAALLTLSKTGMVITLLFFLVGIVVYRPNFLNNIIFRRVKAISIPLIIALLILMFGYNNTKRNTEGGYTTMEFTEEGDVSDVWGRESYAQNFFLDYCYFVQPWSNLNYNISYNHLDGTWGGHTFAQFGKKIGIEIKPVYRMHPTYFNTCTYLTDYYLDFGIIGAIIMSLILGMLIYFCYARYGLSDDPFLVSFYSLVSYATIMLFFSNHFNIGYLLNYFITFGFVSMLYRVNKR